jgi:hemoglobin-like flavoprotein
VFRRREQLNQIATAAEAIETVGRPREIRLTRNGAIVLPRGPAFKQPPLEYRQKDRRMTPQQVALVRQSFAKVVPIREQAAALFYDRLFAIDESTRPLFRGDMKSQGAKLMAAIGAVVKSLDRIETMLDDLRALARRHDRYGVGEEHYASVGAALLWTLEQGLGPDFTPEVQEAWATAYGLLSSAMIAATSEPLRGAA